MCSHLPGGPEAASLPVCDLAGGVPLPGHVPCGARLPLGVQHPGVQRAQGALPHLHLVIQIRHHPGPGRG